MVVSYNDMHAWVDDTPTKVTIQFEHDYFSANNIDVSDGNNIFLIAVKGNEEKELPIESIQMVDSGNSDLYPQVSFDFGGYDSFDKFTLTIEDIQEATFTVRE